MCPGLGRSPSFSAWLYSPSSTGFLFRLQVEAKWWEPLSQSRPIRRIICLVPRGPRLLVAWFEPLASGGTVLLFKNPERKGERMRVRKCVQLWLLWFPCIFPLASIIGEKHSIDSGKRLWRLPLSTLWGLKLCFSPPGEAHSSEHLRSPSLSTQMSSVEGGVLAGGRS